MSRNIENHDSVLLLQDCIAGCKMALESMDDIREHTDDKQLRELIDKYYDEHTGLSVDCRDMLDKAGADIKEPGVFAKMAAAVSINIAMLIQRVWQLQRGSGRLRKKWWEICSHYYKKYKITAVVLIWYNSRLCVAVKHHA